ncbi:hypothetical protein BDV27DRAFT_163926 [Aspergillus caelatus]|uniref:Rhodopsin domain-containing protein n=1 Tax=Aspergillus caelatus TaxID=61420 RepID=A0A5N6ZKS5_9EURO|nr:uncharacterized protein BDV27DRAFT_163926 [Aspergillus caelatus]KAE8358075.1 hypothetical protein BDV27DRAFT_163926 [Aspergillus caelatus]
MANWPEPNYVNPPTRGQGIIITNVIFGVLALITTALRLYSRVKITSTFGIDDVCFLFAVLAAVAMWVVMWIGSARYGWDRHVWDVPLEDLPTTNKLNLAFQITFAVASGLTKLSLLYFCRRLFGNAGRLVFNWHYLFITGTIIIMYGCIIVFVLILLLECRPLKAYWDLNPTYPYTCIDGRAFIFSVSIINIVTDLLCTLIPMTLIWKLQMKTRQKIAVGYLFGLGVLINIAGSLRTYYYCQSIKSPLGDSTWLGFPTFICSSIEIGLGLIVTSAPALRPLVSYYMPKLLIESGYPLTRTTLQNKPTDHTSRSRRQNTAELSIYTEQYPGLEKQHQQRESAEIYEDPYMLFDGIRVTQTVELQTFYQGSETSSLQEQCSEPSRVYSHMNT